MQKCVHPGPPLPQKVYPEGAEKFALRVDFLGYQCFIVSFRQESAPLASSLRVNFSHRQINPDSVPWLRSDFSPESTLRACALQG